jgi:hypothetical protein
MLAALALLTLLVAAIAVRHVGRKRRARLLYIPSGQLDNAARAGFFQGRSP